jgi:hypothetical protein
MFLTRHLNIAISQGQPISTIDQQTLMNVVLERATPKQFGRPQGGLGPSPSSVSVGGDNSVRRALGQSEGVCRDFNARGCSRGSACRFRHTCLKCSSGAHGASTCTGQRGGGGGGSSQYGGRKPLGSGSSVITDGDRKEMAAAAASSSASSSKQ